MQVGRFDMEVADLGCLAGRREKLTGRRCADLGWPTEPGCGFERGEGATPRPCSVSVQSPRTPLLLEPTCASGSGGLSSQGMKFGKNRIALAGRLGL